MGRPFSDNLVRSIKERSNTNSHTLGTRLAELCIEANINAGYVAEMLNTSRMTVYNWFRDKVKIRKRNAPEVEQLISRIEKDLNDGILPIKTPAEGKTYAQYRPNMGTNVDVENHVTQGTEAASVVAEENTAPTV
jgi:hypothetical protein